jgi:hypothetical protein
VKGERRKVVTGIPGKTGIIYTLDRQTGEFLWARPTNFQNVISKIDGAIGVVTVNPAALSRKQMKSTSFARRRTAAKTGLQAHTVL